MMKAIHSKMLTTLFLITCVAVGPGMNDAHAKFSKALKGKTKTEDGNADVEMTAALGVYKGLKHAIGVIDFENQAGWGSQYKLGYNLGIMLESALYDSGRFIVLERQNLDAVLQEQDLQNSNRTAQASKAAQTGSLRSARYLATGAITEFEERQAGDAGGVRIRGFKIGASGGTAQITAIVKLVDTTTGEIVAKERVVGKAGRTGLTVGYHRRGYGGQLGSFAKTPIGEAAQDVINQAVIFFSKEMEDYDFTASVVMVSKKGEIIINRGATYGVYPGQSFIVEEEGEQLIDPDSGEILGESQGEVIAQIRCLRVQEKIAYCELVDGSSPARGSVVKAAN